MALKVDEDPWCWSQGTLKESLLPFSRQFRAPELLSDATLHGLQGLRQVINDLGADGRTVLQLSDLRLLQKCYTSTYTLQLMISLANALRTRSPQYQSSLLAISLNSTAPDQTQKRVGESLTKEGNGKRARKLAPSLIAPSSSTFQDREGNLIGHSAEEVPVYSIQDDISFPHASFDRSNAPKLDLDDDENDEFQFHYFDGVDPREAKGQVKAYKQYIIDWRIIQERWDDESLPAYGESDSELDLESAELAESAEPGNDEAEEEDEPQGRLSPSHLDQEEARFIQQWSQEQLPILERKANKMRAQGSRQSINKVTKWLGSLETRLSKIKRDLLKINIPQRASEQLCETMQPTIFEIMECKWKIKLWGGTPKKTPTIRIKLRSTNETTQPSTYTRQLRETLKQVGQSTEICNKRGFTLLDIQDTLFDWTLRSQRHHPQNVTQKRATSPSQGLKNLSIGDRRDANINATGIQPDPLWQNYGVANSSRDVQFSGLGAFQEAPDSQSGECSQWNVLTCESSDASAPVEIRDEAPVDTSRFMETSDGEPFEPEITMKLSSGGSHTVTAPAYIAREDPSAMDTTREYDNRINGVKPIHAEARRATVPRGKAEVVDLTSIPSDPSSPAAPASPSKSSLQPFLMVRPRAKAAVPSNLPSGFYPTPRWVPPIPDPRAFPTPALRGVPAPGPVAMPTLPGGSHASPSHMPPPPRPGPLPLMQVLHLENPLDASIGDIQAWPWKKLEYSGDSVRTVIKILFIILGQPERISLKNLLASNKRFVDDSVQGVLKLLWQTKSFRRTYLNAVDPSTSATLCLLARLYACWFNADHAYVKADSVEKSTLSQILTESLYKPDHDFDQFKDYLQAGLSMFKPPKESSTVSTSLAQEHHTGRSGTMPETMYDKGRHLNERIRHAQEQENHSIHGLPFPAQGRYEQAKAIVQARILQGTGSSHVPPQNGQLMEATGEPDIILDESRLEDSRKPNERVRELESRWEGEATK
ncbi:hypothetical protein EV356DRAFT_529068 [Viridothelium virens]|uniref:DUF7607 domain-containing protein n=1 Tax=Viridothelium virens TaxID=1048519 RepID=A0A6A6HM47_VIRVR|nr:hypothetical protein EV356DRAFT_529068 [Viridothelium virens]